MAGVVLFGLGQIAEVVHALLTEAGVTVAGFTVDAAHLPAGSFHGLPAGSFHGLPAASFHGLPAVAFEEVERHFPPETNTMLVAIGYHDLNRVRAARCAAAKAKGYRLASFVSEAAHVVKGTRIGENCVVMPGAALQPHAVLGDDVFVWHNTVIGHHAVIGDHGWLASNATVSSATTLAPRCFVGVNAAIGHGIALGEACIIGAGAVVTGSHPDGTVLIEAATPRFRLDSERFARFTKMT